MKRNFSILLLLLTNFSVTAQEYLWPTDASPYMTSSFSESRPRRYHAGIDIKTWNQVGYKVFAVRSGHIERLAVSPFGYGRVLYLRLDTGETAVYAHLQSFSDKLQAIAEREQERIGRYSIEKFFTPGTLPIEQGEVIAYTGDSGSGAPHLHFELRDARHRPFNPLLRGFKIQDNVPPVITAVAFSPLEAGAMINGDFLPVILQPRRQNGGLRLPETVHLAGKAGVAIGVYDQADGVDNRFGIYRLQLFVDDLLQFQSQYDRFSYGQNKLIELDQDILLKRRGFGTFHRFYRVVGNSLGFYSNLNATGGALVSRPDVGEQNREEIAAAQAEPNASEAVLKGLAWGKHHLRVVAEDFYGNRTEVHAELLVGPAFTITPHIHESQPTRVTIDPQPSPAHREILQFEAAVANRSSRTIISPWRPTTAQWQKSIMNPQDPGASDLSFDVDTLHTVSAVADEMPPSTFPSARVLTLQTNRAEIVRLVAVDQYGISSHPTFIFNRTARESLAPILLHVDRDFYPNYLRLLIRANQPLAGVPIVKFSTGRKTLEVQCIPQQPYRYVASVPLAEIAGDSVVLEIAVESLFGEQETWKEWFANSEVRPGRDRSIFAPDAKMRVAFANDSVYWPIYGRITIDTTTRIPDQRVIGPIYRVEPQDVPLSNAAVVSLAYPDTVAQPQQLGVGYFDRDRWTFIDNNVNASTYTVSARVLSLENFALIRDNEPPVLRINSPRPGAITRQRSPLISVDVYDSTSGFKSEESIELLLDGKRLIAEYDPERRLVQYRPKQNLDTGLHKVSVIAEDRCGNVTRLEWEFTIQ